MGCDCKGESRDCLSRHSARHGWLGPTVDGVSASGAGGRAGGIFTNLQIAIFLRTREVYVSWTDAIVGCSLCFLIGEEQRD